MIIPDGRASNRVEAEIVETLIWTVKTVWNMGKNNVAKNLWSLHDSYLENQEWFGLGQIQKSLRQKVKLIRAQGIPLALLLAWPHSVRTNFFGSL